jgi:hypothetical protein
VKMVVRHCLLLETPFHRKMFGSNQGNKMSLWKHRPKSSLTFFVKIYTFYSGKSSPKVRLLLTFSKNGPKWTIAHVAKIRPIWSPWFKIKLLINPNVAFLKPWFTSYSWNLYRAVHKIV